MPERRFADAASARRAVAVSRPMSATSAEPLRVRKRGGERERFDPLKLRAALLARGPQAARPRRPGRGSGRPDRGRDRRRGRRAELAPRSASSASPGWRSSTTAPTCSSSASSTPQFRRLRRRFRGRVPSGSKARMPSYPHKLLRGEGTMGKTAAKSAQPGDQGLTVERRFTTAGTDPYDEVEWELRDAIIGDPDDPAFEQREVEFPAAWSQNATNIVAQKYFRGSLGAPERERSVKQMISRVAGTIAELGARRRLLRDRRGRGRLRGRADPHPAAPEGRLQQPRLVQRRLAQGRRRAVLGLLHPLASRTTWSRSSAGTPRRG